MEFFVYLVKYSLMALEIMKKVKEVVQEPGKTTLPTVTVTGIRKKIAPKYPIVQRGRKSFGMIDMMGDTTKLTKEEFEKVTGKKSK